VIDFSFPHTHIVTRRAGGRKEEAMRLTRVYAKRGGTMLAVIALALSVLPGVGYAEDVLDDNNVQPTVPFTHTIPLPDSRGVDLGVTINGERQELAKRDRRVQQTLEITFEATSPAGVSNVPTGKVGCSDFDEIITLSVGNSAGWVKVLYTYTTVDSAGTTAGPFTEGLERTGLDASTDPLTIAVDGCFG
jgi:hypothetical protein